MKRSTSFRLSDEAKDILKAKAKLFGRSETSTLELFIKEFASSTNSERKSQIIRRRKALLEYLGNEPDDDIRRAWEAGFRAGWSQYQIRHDRNLFNINS